MELEKLRNFVIISHIDHGKSTLADRFLELTKTISSKKMKPQFLDMMDLEKERGITIKLQPCRMEYSLNNETYILNLIDTPGHIDFSYEVSRSLAAVEGAVLLVDAGKGIQAQTLANLNLAQEQNLIIIPVVNKIDLPQAKIEQTTQEIANLLKIDQGEVIKISAKLGTNVVEILAAIVKKIPCPKKENLSNSLRALIFDSRYDSFKGVIAYVRIVDGEIETGQKIKLSVTGARGEIKELGYFNPDFFPQRKLQAGEIGYIATGIKESGKVRVGDTIQILNSEVNALPGYKEPQPMVFVSLYPENPNDFDLLKDGLVKLKLNDPALIFEAESKESLGRGFRCGFLGNLHIEIVSERLKREFGLDLIISSPSVVFKITDNKNREKFIYSPSDWPEALDIKESEEPWVSLEVMTPTKYMGGILEILNNLGGKYIDTKYSFSQFSDSSSSSSDRTILIYEIPLREIIANLYDRIKGATQGYASMNYKVLGFRKADLVKMEILIAGKIEKAFSKIITREKVLPEARSLVKKLKEVLPAQQFSVALQASLGGKIIARETIKARRKDVTGALYGGDYSRKRKLLEKQKKGKKELKAAGKMKIPPKAFLEVFRG
jgi:GTP-binding protein LepA